MNDEFTFYEVIYNVAKKKGHLIVLSVFPTASIPLYLSMHVGLEQNLKIYKIISKTL